jgi:hypothetical protein
MRSKPSICFISEKWVDANPNLPRSTNLTNLHSTAQQCKLFSSVYNLYVDELYYAQQGKGTVNNILEELDRSGQLDLVDIIFITHIGDSFLNPDPQIINAIKKNKKVIYSWPDTVWPWIDKELNRTNQIADFHIAHDIAPKRVEQLVKPNKIYSLGLSQDENIFYYTRPEEKPIDLCFIGTQYGERESILKQVKANFPKLNMYISGGARVDKLTFEEYGRILRDSKICINFSRSPVGVDQIKCRIFETAACNTLLLDSENTQTPEMFRKDIDYKSFSSAEEACSIIQHMLDNSSERISIANSAYEYYQEMYSPLVYWRNVLQRLGYDQ